MSKKKDEFYTKGHWPVIITLAVLLTVIIGGSYVLSGYIVEGMCKQAMKKDPKAKDYPGCKEFNL